MTSDRLFIELVHRLGHYADAMVLFALLKEQADIREFESTKPKIARRQLAGSVTEVGVRRSLERLQRRGLISVRTHANTRTHVAVARDAVLRLLRTPVGSMLPGSAALHFPFLEAWDADIAAARAASATEAPESVPDPTLDSGATAMRPDHPSPPTPINQT